MSNQQGQDDTNSHHDAQNQIESDYEYARRLQEMENMRGYVPPMSNSFEQMFTDSMPPFMRMNSGPQPPHPHPHPQPHPQPQPQPGPIPNQQQRSQNGQQRRPNDMEGFEMFSRLFDMVTDREPSFEFGMGTNNGGNPGRTTYTATFHTSTSNRRPSSASAAAAEAAARRAGVGGGSGTTQFFSMNPNNNNNNNNDSRSTRQNNNSTPMDIEEEIFRHFHGGPTPGRRGDRTDRGNRPPMDTLESFIYRIGNEVAGNRGNNGANNGADGGNAGRNPFGTGFHFGAGGTFNAMPPIFAQMFGGGNWTEMGDGPHTFEEIIELIERMGGNVNAGASQDEINKVEKHKYSKDLMKKIAQRRNGENVSLSPETSSEHVANADQGQSSDSKNTDTDDEEKCAICLGGYEDDEEVRILPCQHVYHVECVDQWLKVKHLCPVCKKSIREGEHNG